MVEKLNLQHKHTFYCIKTWDDSVLGCNGYECLPKYRDELLARWAPELGVHAVFENPYDSAHKEEEDPSYTPHLPSKWLHKCPWTRLHLLSRSNHDEARLQIRLCEVDNPGSVCSDGHISNSSIICLSKATQTSEREDERR